VSPLSQAQAKGRRIGKTDLPPEQVIAMLAAIGPERETNDDN
jgi:hypothetical protein